MASIIIHTSNDRDLSLLQELAQRMGFKSQVLNVSQKEDLALAEAIEENNPDEVLSFNDAKEYYNSLNKVK